MNIEIIYSGIMGLLGSCIGSFLYLLQTRLIISVPPYYQSVRLLYHPRSHCLKCCHKLEYWQLIPILSWLYLRGRCYYCQKKIPISTICTELLFMLIFILSSQYIKTNPHQVIFILLSCWFYILSCYDIKYYLLPDMLIYPLLIGGLICSLVGYIQNDMIQACINCTVVYITLRIIAAIYYYYKKYPGLGFGDIKLMTALSCWYPLNNIPIILMIACSGGLLWFLIFNHTHTRKIKKIAFGPFILFGAWIIILYN